jgi:hypothetical protein
MTTQTPGPAALSLRTAAIPRAADAEVVVAELDFQGQRGALEGLTPGYDRWQAPARRAHHDLESSSMA